MAANSLGDTTSTSEQIANIVDMVPLSDYFKMRLRILKVGEFHYQTLLWLQRDLGVKSPLD